MLQEFKKNLRRMAAENLRTFEGPGFEDLKAPKPTKSSLSAACNRGCFDGCFEKMWEILDDPHSTKLAKIFSLISCFMIIISVSGYCLSTMETLKENILLRNINYVCVTFFTVEFTLRLISTPNLKLFIRDYKNWIDLFSVAPSYLVLVFPKAEWVKNLVIIRVLRVVKFFKLSYGLQVLLQTLKASFTELGLLLLILLIPLVIFSSLVYAVEYNVDDSKSAFTSVPLTFWYCIITMTTVGYGDFAPKTMIGRIIGSMCAIVGLLIVALPISVIGGNFSLYYSHVKARLKLPRKNRTLQQDNMLGLLRHPLGLSLRHRDRKSLKRTKHHAIRLKTDVVVSPTSAIKILQRQECYDEILKHDDIEIRRPSRRNTISSEGTDIIPEMIPLIERANRRRNALTGKAKQASLEASLAGDLEALNYPDVSNIDYRRLTNNEDIKIAINEYRRTPSTEDAKLSISEYRRLIPNSDDSFNPYEHNRDEVNDIVEDLNSETGNSDNSKYRERTGAPRKTSNRFRTSKLVKQYSMNDIDRDNQSDCSKRYSGFTSLLDHKSKSSLSNTRSSAGSLKSLTNPYLRRRSRETKTGSSNGTSPTEGIKETLDRHFRNQKHSNISLSSESILLKILDQLTTLIKLVDERILKSKTQKTSCVFEDNNVEKLMTLFSKYVIRNDSYKSNDDVHVDVRNERNMANNSDYVMLMNHEADDGSTLAPTEPPPYTREHGTYTIDLGTDDHSDAGEYGEHNFVGRTRGDDIDIESGR